MEERMSIDDQLIFTKRLCEKLYDNYLQQGDYCDTRVITTTASVYAHAVVLVSSSPQIALLVRESKQKGAKIKYELDLRSIQCTHGIAKSLLRFCYLGVLDTTHVANLSRLQHVLSHLGLWVTCHTDVLSPTSGNHSQSHQGLSRDSQPGAKNSIEVQANASCNSGHFLKPVSKDLLDNATKSFTISTEGQRDVSEIEIAKASIQNLASGRVLPMNEISCVPKQTISITNTENGNAQTLKENPTDRRLDENKISIPPSEFIFTKEMTNSENEVIHGGEIPIPQNSAFSRKDTSSEHWVSNNKESTVSERDHKTDPLSVITSDDLKNLVPILTQDEIKVLFSPGGQSENESEMAYESQSNLEQNPSVIDVGDWRIENHPLSAEQRNQDGISSNSLEKVEGQLCAAKLEKDIPLSPQQTVKNASDSLYGAAPPLSVYSQINHTTYNTELSTSHGNSTSGERVPLSSQVNHVSSQIISSASQVNPITPNKAISSPAENSLKRQIAELFCDPKIQALLKNETLSEILSKIQNKKVEENTHRQQDIATKELPLNADILNAKPGMNNTPENKNLSPLPAEIVLGLKTELTGNADSPATTMKHSPRKLRKRKADTDSAEEQADFSTCEQSCRDKIQPFEAKTGDEGSAETANKSTVIENAKSTLNIKERLIMESSTISHPTTRKIPTSTSGKKRASNAQGLLHCRRCRATFTSKAKKDKHLKVEDWVRCPESDCDFSSCTEHGVVTHLRTTHAHPVTWLRQHCTDLLQKVLCQVPGCDFIADDWKGARSHESMHAPDKRYSCDFCEKEFKHRHTQEAHTAACHGGEALTCEHCGKTFVTKHNLQTHVKRIHRGDKPGKFYCERCGFDANNNRKLLTHIWTAHDIPPPAKYQRFQCNICGYKTLQKGGYEVHLRRHKGERSHVCDLCGRSYITEHELSAHQEYHKKQGDRKYKCDACAFTAVTAYKLQRHQAAVHSSTGEKQYVCEVCEYRTNVRGNLTLHLRNTHKLQVETRKPIQARDTILRTTRGAVCGDVSSKAKHEQKSKNKSGGKATRKTNQKSALDVNSAVKLDHSFLTSPMSLEPPPNVSLVPIKSRATTLSVIPTPTHHNPASTTSQANYTLTSQTNYTMTSQNNGAQGLAVSANYESRDNLMTSDLTGPEIRILSNQVKAGVAESACSEAVILASDPGAYDANILVYGLDPMLQL